MHIYKLAAFDMDGTLLDSNKKIRPDSIDALKQASKEGKILCLSTGRNRPELSDYMTDLSMMKYLICISGALILDNTTKQPIYERPLEKEIVIQLFELSKKFDALLHLHSIKSHVEKRKLNQLEDYGMGLYRSLFDRVSTLHDDLYQDYLKEPYPVYKFNFYCKNTTVREELEKYTTKLPITVCHAEAKSSECSAQGISKSSGLEFICEREGIDISNTIALGDGDNDIEILKAAGLGIAMGNACDNVLKIADAKVDTCDNGGIKEAINKYLLNGEK